MYSFICLFVYFFIYNFIRQAILVCNLYNIYIYINKHASSYGLNPDTAGI